MDGDQVELLERARAGDAPAFSSLVGLWGDTTFRTAWLITGDRAGAEAAVQRAWLGCWAELPSFHSQRAFRPWLMSTVVEAAREHAGEAPPVLAALADADPELRVTAALRYGAGFRLGEIAIAQIATLATTRKRLREVQAVMMTAPDAPDEEGVRRVVADSLRGVELVQSFFEDSLQAHLARSEVFAVVRELDGHAASLWRVADTPEGLGALAGAELRGRSAHEGARLIGAGKLAERWRAREEILVTRAAAPAMLAFTTRARVLGATTPVELRSSLQIADHGAAVRVRYRLDGVATVPGAFHRLSPRALRELPERLRGPMHRGLERLAALAGERARA